MIQEVVQNRLGINLETCDVPDISMPQFAEKRRTRTLF